MALQVRVRVHVAGDVTVITAVTPVTAVTAVTLDPGSPFQRNNVPPPAGLRSQARPMQAMRSSSLAENRSRAQGRGKLSVETTKPDARKLGALRVSAFLPCALREPRRRRSHRARKGRVQGLRRSIMGNRAVITTPERKMGLYLH